MESAEPVAVSDVDVAVKEPEADAPNTETDAPTTSTPPAAEVPSGQGADEGASPRASVVSADVTTAAAIASPTSAGAHVIPATEDDGSVSNSLASSAQAGDLAQSLKEIDLGKGSRDSTGAAVTNGVAEAAATETTEKAAEGDAAPERSASRASTASLTSTIDAKRARSHSFADFVGRNEPAADGKKKAWLHAPEDFIGEGIKFDLTLVGREEVERPRGIATIKEAIAKLKEGQQESSPVTLCVSVNGTRVIDIATKKVAFKHAIHRILFVSEVGTNVGFLAKEPFSGKHEVLVFESPDAAERIAITLGQAFEVAYRKFKKDNAIAEDTDFQDVDLAANGGQQSPSKGDGPADASAAAAQDGTPRSSTSTPKRSSVSSSGTPTTPYETARQQKKLSHENLLAFADSGNIKTLVIRKKQNERLGFMVMLSGPSAPVPGIFVSHVYPGSPTARCGGLSVGDQILTVNGTSVVGKPFEDTITLINAVSAGCEVTVQYVPTEAIIEIEFTRDAGQRLGFDVYEGEVTGVDKGGLADKAGLCIGYRIIEVNGKSVVGYGHDAIVSVLKAAIGAVHIRLMQTQLYRVLVTSSHR